MWVKTDDEMADHPKILRAAETVGDSALATMVAALGYCNRKLTDGRVPAAAVRGLTHHARPKVVAQALVDAGLWEPVDGGYQVHDFHEYQPSKADVEAERAKGAKRVAKHRGRKTLVTPAGNAVTSPVSNGSNAVLSRGGAGGERVTGNGDVAVDVDARARLLDAIPPGDDPVLVRWRETAEILVGCRLELDLQLLGISNMLAAYPDADHVKAARIVVARSTDPEYRTKSAANAWRYTAIQLANEASPRPGRPATPEPFVSKYGKGRPHATTRSDAA